MLFFLGLDFLQNYVVLLAIKYVLFGWVSKANSSFVAGLSVRGGVLDVVLMGEKVDLLFQFATSSLVL